MVEMAVEVGSFVDIFILPIELLHALIPIMAMHKRAARDTKREKFIGVLKMYMDKKGRFEMSNVKYQTLWAL